MKTTIKKHFTLFISFLFLVQSPAFAQLPNNTLDLYLTQNLSKESIVENLIKDPENFEKNLKALSKQVRKEQLSNQEYQLIKDLEVSITSSAARYNSSQQNKHLLIKIAGAVIGAAVVGYSSKVISEQVFTSQHGADNFGSLIISMYAPVLIVGVSVLGGGTIGYYATKTYLNKEKLNEKSNILD
jgi:hypothetical protein